MICLLLTLSAETMNEPAKYESGKQIPVSDTTSPQGEVTETPRLLFNPPIDIYETENGLVLYADLPGVSTENLELEVQDNRLALFGKVPSEDQSHGTLHREYEIGDFLRSFILSDDVDHERISARLTNGVLRVELPKNQKTEPRRISINVE